MNNQPQKPIQQSPQVGKKSILVAEDDKFYANIYKAKLTREGYDVIIAEDGEKTLEAAREKKPDLILLDLIMPVKDGFETLKELRADEKLKDIKVIVLSNLGQEEDIKKVKDLGIVDYLVKTNVSIQKVVDKVKEHLAQSYANSR